MDFNKISELYEKNTNLIPIRINRGGINFLSWEIKNEINVNNKFLFLGLATGFKNVDVQNHYFCMNYETAKFLNWCLKKNINLKKLAPSGFFMSDFGGNGKNAASVISMINSWSAYIKKSGIKDDSFREEELIEISKNFIKKIESLSELKNFFYYFSDCFSTFRNGNDFLSKDNVAFEILSGLNFNNFSSRQLELVRSFVKKFLPSYTNELDVVLESVKKVEYETIKVVNDNFDVLALNKNDFKNKFVLSGNMVSDINYDQLLEMNCSKLNKWKSKEDFKYKEIILGKNSSKENGTIILINKMTDFEITDFKLIFDLGLKWFQKLTQQEPLNEPSDFYTIKRKWEKTIDIMLEQERLNKKIITPEKEVIKVKKI